MIVAELGLRYRPAAVADLEAHTALIALLCRDLADIPPEHLQRAADQWARTSPFMPKAADLVRLAQSFLDGRASYVQSASLANQYNAIMDRQPEPRTDIEWVGSGNSLRLQWKQPEPPPIRRPKDAAEAARFNAAMRRFGATIRYRDDGTEYEISRSDADDGGRTDRAGTH